MRPQTLSTRLSRVLCISAMFFSAFAYCAEEPPLAVTDKDLSCQKGGIIRSDVSGNDDLKNAKKEDCKWSIADEGSAGANGMLDMEDNGTFVFAPAADFVGNVSFTYKLEHSGKQTTAEVHMKVSDGLIAASTEERELIFSTGFNFDLIDGIKANAAYIDLRATVPAYVPKEGGWRLGVEAGIYRFKSFSFADSGYLAFYNKREIIQGADTTTEYLSTLAKGRRSRTYDNFGLTLGPSFDVLVPGGRSRLRVVPLISWYRTWMVTETRLSEFDTTITPQQPEEWSTVLTTRAPEPLQNSRRTVDNFMITLGAGYNYSNSFGILDLHIYAGLGTTTYQQPLSFGSTRVTAWRNYVYGLRLEFTETKKTGIRIGAEVRSFKERDGGSQPILEQQVAWFNVYLVKEFNLEKLAGFFTK